MRPDTPARPKAQTKHPGAPGPRLARVAAQAATSLKLDSLDVSEALLGERWELLLARGRDRGTPYTLAELAELDASGRDYPAPGPETFALLERVAARCRIRRELGLPQDSCAQPEDRTCCHCQTEALDQLLDEGVKPTRRRVGQLARKRHYSAGKRHLPPPRPKPDPDPQEPPPSPQEVAESLLGPSPPDSPAKPEHIPAQPEQISVGKTEKRSTRRPSYVWMSQKSRESRSEAADFANTHF
jgi:hypothetical protein